LSLTSTNATAPITVADSSTTGSIIIAVGMLVGVPVTGICVVRTSVASAVGENVGAVVVAPAVGIPVGEDDAVFVGVLVAEKVGEPVSKLAVMAVTVGSGVGGTSCAERTTPGTASSSALGS